MLFGLLAVVAVVAAAAAAAAAVVVIILLVFILLVYYLNKYSECVTVSPCLAYSYIFAHLFLIFNASIAFYEFKSCCCSCSCCCCSSSSCDVFQIEPFLLVLVADFKLF